MTVRRLLLVRHGQTPYNRDRRFTGWHDPALTRRGRAEARALGRALRDERIDAVYTSDLRRTVETARLATDGRDGLQPYPEAALREANFGAWQGLTYDEARLRDPDAYEALARRSVEFCAPGGETIPQVHERVIRFLQRLHEGHAGEHVLLVASGGPLQILIADQFAMPIAAHWRLWIANCSLNIIDFVRGEPILTLLNGRAHLSRFGPPLRSR